MADAATTKTRVDVRSVAYLMSSPTTDVATETDVKPVVSVSVGGSANAAMQDVAVSTNRSGVRSTASQVRPTTQNVAVGWCVPSVADAATSATTTGNRAVVAQTAAVPTRTVAANILSRALTLERVVDEVRRRPH